MIKYDRGQGAFDPPWSISLFESEWLDKYLFTCGLGLKDTLPGVTMEIRTAMCPILL